VGEEDAGDIDLLQDGAVARDSALLLDEPRTALVIGIFPSKPARKLRAISVG
jgi:hypothetical protein